MNFNFNFEANTNEKSLKCSEKWKHHMLCDTIESSRTRTQGPLGEIV